MDASMNEASMDAIDVVDAALPKSGYIGLEVRGGQSRPVSSTAYANFDREPFDARSFPEADTPCQVMRVPEPTDGGIPDAGPPSSESAGTIHISGPPGSIALTFDGTGYSRFDSTDEAWNGGDTVTIAAEGAETPAFMQSILFPRHANWMLPLADMSGSVPVGRTQPLGLQWDPTDGIIEVVLGFSGGNVGDVDAVVCAFDASAGHAMIGPEVLQDVPLTNSAAMHYGSITVTAINRRRFQAGDRDLIIEARTYVYAAGVATF
jgi:hypothetical protein